MVERPQQEIDVATAVTASHRRTAKTGGKAELCAEHAEEGMVNVVSSRCGHDGCSKPPSYTAKTGGKAERCAEHAEGGMAHVNER